MGFFDIEFDIEIDDDFDSSIEKAEEYREEAEFDSNAIEKAEEVYRKRISMGYEDAYYDLISMYSEGVGCDFKKAVYWLNKAYDRGLEVTKSEINEFKRLAKLQENAEKGDAQDWANFANLLYSRLPEGTDAEYRACFKWAEKATLHDNLDGIYLLAVLYQRGLGVRDNQGKAISLFERAAELGHLESKYNLACYYLYDGITEADYIKGIELLKEAANGRYMRAIKELSECYRKGLGVEANETEAEKWHTKYQLEEKGFDSSCL